MKSLLLFVILFGISPAFGIETAFETDRGLPLVNVNLAVKAGAAHDPKDASGLSNFMGEMLLRGTRSKTKEQIDQQLDQLGATLSVETRSEALIVRGSVISSQLEPFLSLMSEIVTEPNFPDREIKKLKAEITSALLEQLGSDSALATRWYNRFLFQGHPYGKPILGTIHDVQGLSRDKVVAQYETFFRDSYLLVVGSGDASESTLKDWASSIAKQRPDAVQFPKIARVDAPQDAPERRLLIVDKPDRTQTQINGGEIGMRQTDPDFFPFYLGNFAFGGPSFSSRMMVEIRVKRGWSYGANSYLRYGLKPRSWQFHLFPAAKDTPPALALTIDMVKKLKQGGLTPKEFDFFKQVLINGAGFDYNTPKKRVENKLIERTLELPDGFYKNIANELSKVSLKDTNTALARHLKPDQLTVVVVGTAKDLKPKLAKVAGVPLGQVKVVKYTED